MGVLFLLLIRVTLKPALTVPFSKFCSYAPSFGPCTPVSSLPVNSLLLVPVFFFFPNLLPSPNCHPDTPVNLLLVPQIIFCYSSISWFAPIFFLCLSFSLSFSLSISPYPHFWIYMFVDISSWESENVHPIC